MDSIRSHRDAYPAQQVELLSKFPVEVHWGMQQESLAAEANHRHPRSYCEPVK
jgi:hypothetical protein